MHKLIKKILLHFINPIQSIKFDIRKLLFLFKKYKLTRVYNIDFQINESLFEPDYCDLDNLINLIFKYKPKLFLEMGGGYSTLAIAYAFDVLKKNIIINIKLFLMIKVKNI